MKPYGVVSSEETEASAHAHSPKHGRRRVSPPAMGAEGSLILTQILAYVYSTNRFPS